MEYKTECELYMFLLHSKQTNKQTCDMGKIINIHTIHQIIIIIIIIIIKLKLITIHIYT